MFQIPRKKHCFLNYFKEKLNKNISTKDIYKNTEEFLSTINNCSEISFTHSGNLALFNNDSKKKQALIDLTGTDSPEVFTIIAKYKKHTDIADFIRELFADKKDNYIDSLTICGSDDEDFQFIYNGESFLKKLPVTCNKDENGKYDSENVKESLLRNIIK